MRVNLDTNIIKTSVTGVVKTVQPTEKESAKVLINATPKDSVDIRDIIKNQEMMVSVGEFFSKFIR